MADAREATEGSEQQQTSKAKAGVFNSIKAATAAEERGEACVHLNLTKAPQALWDPEQGMIAAQAIAPEELAELVDALPRLTHLKTLLLECKQCVEVFEATPTPCRVEQVTMLHVTAMVACQATSFVQKEQRHWRHLWLG